MGAESVDAVGLFLLTLVVILLWEIKRALGSILDQLQVRGVKVWSEGQDDD